MKNEGKYSKEFKQSAVKLLQSGDKTASGLAMELGVKRTLLYRWQEQLEENGEKAFHARPGRPRKEDQGEVARLRQELRDITEERDILKKAAAYFARDLK